MPTRSIPLACPHCGHGTIYHLQGQPPRCGRCEREIPLGPPVPTEADRLRSLVERAVPFATALAVSGDAKAIDWLAGARAVLEEKP